MTPTWLVVALLLTPSLARAQVITTEIREMPVSAAEVSPLHLMSPEKFEAAGLSKLSPAELEVLAGWVRRHARLVGQLAYGAGGSPEVVQPVQPASLNRIETRMAGDFTGWDGATVFQLANGQLWQQQSFGRLHQYERSPSVVLVATPSGWRMEVEGVSQTVYVRRIR